MTLREAIKVLVKDEYIGDFVYSVRERVLSDTEYKGSSWDHPRVKHYADAVAALKIWLDNEEKNV